MQDIEIICVNDGSTDHSLEILEEYASKDPRIKIISQENKGLLLARKVGVHHATGEYSLFLDSDDWLELNACEKLYNAIKQYDVEILQFQCITENDNNNSHKGLTNTNQFLKNKRVSGIEAFSHMLKNNAMNALWAKLIQSTLLKNVYSFIENIFVTLAEDVYTNFPLYYLAKSYYCIEESYYHYRLNSGISTSHQLIREQFELINLSAKNAYDGIRHFLDSHNYNEIDHLMLEQRALSLQYWLTYWCYHEINVSNSKAFDFVVDTWGIVPVLLRLARIYNTLEKQAKLAQSLQGSQILANKPIKNIHTIATYIPDLRNGGSERTITQAMSYWIQLGYKVVLFTNEAPTESDYSYSPEVLRIILPQNLPERLETLQECIKKYNIDIMIHFAHWDNNLFWDLSLCKACNIPFIAYHGNIFIFPTDNLIAPFCIYCNAILNLSRVDQLYRSAYTKSMLYPKSLVTSMPKYNTLPHNTKPVILWLGRLNESQKRYTHAILIMEKVIQQIPEAQLLVVGSSSNGSAELELQSMIQQKNLENNVKLCGHSNHVEDYYQQASIFLMTSAFEGFPNTIIEVYSWGLPVVLYDLPYSEVIRKFQGHICVSQEDIQGAANAIVSLLQNPEKLIALGNSGRASLEEYLKTDFKEQWKQIFLSLESEEDRIEPPEDTKILINTFSEHYFKLSQTKQDLERKLSQTKQDLERKLSQAKKQLQPLQPFRSQIPAYTTLATALVGFHSHFPFLFRIFSFMIRRSYSVFFSLKNYGLKATIAKIAKFFIKKLKIAKLISKLANFIKLFTDSKYRFFRLNQLGFYRLVNDKVYTKKIFYYKTGKHLKLNSPKTFTEKLQWLKLYDRKSEYTTMVDKYAVKKYVADRIGEQYIIPTLGVWERFDDIDFNMLPNQFVLKCTHDSGGVIICRSKSKFDLETAKKKINSSLKRNYYYAHREWPYKNVPPRIIAECYMEDTQTTDLRDYKFFCFNGDPIYCQVISDRTFHMTIDFFDMEWNHQEFTGLTLGKPFCNSPIPIPIQFDKMKEIAKILAKESLFLRVDFYEVKGNLYFGELTFYPNAGYGNFIPDKYNLILGEMLKLPENHKFMYNTIKKLKKILHLS